MVSIEQPSRRRGQIATCATRAALAALAAILVLGVTEHAHATATLEARLERDVVPPGDTVRLTLRYGGDVAPERPDLSPLQQDFEILGTDQRQQLAVVNGRVQATRELGVLLSPRRSGALTIPALHAGGVATEPLTLTVLDAATRGAPSGAPASAPGGARVAANADAPDLFVEALADQTSPLVQGEVRYTVRVFDGVGIREGALTEPAADGVRVEPIGDTATFEQTLNGRRYMVHERRYALFPQTSGEVTVPPVVLQARVADQPQRGRGGRGSAFDDAFGGSFGDDVVAEMFARMRAGGLGSSLLDRMMNAGREVRVRSNAVSLSVQGRPDGAAEGWFLPARAVTLSESWQPANPAFRVGEAVRRVVTLRAEGASPQQLPEITLAEIAGVKQYAGRPEQRTQPAADGLTAELVQTFDVLPSQAGSFTLPQIDVPWWDTATSTQRTASLPAQTIEVLPAAGTTPAGAAAVQQAAGASGQTSVGTAASAAVPAAVSAATANVPGAAPSTTAAAPEPSSADGLHAILVHPTAAAGGTLLLLLLAGAAWWRLQRGRASSTGNAAASRTAPAAHARALVDTLHQACASNDAPAVRDALLAWGRASWPEAPPSSAGAIARRLAHRSFMEAVKSLDDSLYAPRATSFDGTTLWKEFSAARKTAGSRSDSPAEPLPALYPSSRVA